MHCIGSVVLGVLAPLAIQQDTSRIDTIIRMPEIVVSATRTGQANRLDQPVALSLIEPDIAEVSRGNVAADLLRDLPGVHVQQTSAGQGAVVLRGLIGNQVLLLVDGVPLNNGTYRDGPGQYLATIDPESIERIEVIRGPASVLYGSDAQGGVVNIVSKSHRFAGTRSVRVSGRASTANSGYRGRVSAGVQGSRLSIGVGGSLGTADNLKAGGGIGAQVPTGFDVAGIDAEVTYLLNDHHEVKGVVQHFEMDDVPRFDRYVTFRAPEPGKDYEHRFDPQTRQLAYTRYTYTPRIGAVARVEATASLAVQREGRNRIRLSNGEPDTRQTLWRDDAYTPGLSVSGLSILSLAGSPLALTWGGDYYHDQMNTEGYVVDLETGDSTAIVRETHSGSVSSGRFPDGAKADRAGLFISGELGVTQWLRLSAGLRWSHFENRANVGLDLGGEVENVSSDLSGQLGIVAAPTEELRLMFRLAEGFRAPNLYDLTNVGPVPAGIVLPNPSARPERSLSTELGVRYSAQAAALDISIYHTRIKDFIDRLPGVFNGDTLLDGERVYLGTNVGIARMYGFEAEGIVRVGRVEARATALYTHGEQEDATSVKAPMAKIPPLSGSAGLRWTSSQNRFWAEYVFSWASRQDRLGIRDLDDPRIPDGGTPGFAAHGLGAGVSLLPRISVSAGLENLTDELYRNHASGVDNAGRHVWVGVTAVGVL
jgi:outer membrane receptor protein involved in Fe transport